MDSSLGPRLQTIHQTLRLSYHRLPKSQRIVINNALVAVSGPLTFFIYYFIYTDYSAWLRMDRSGLPHDFFGYFI